MKKWKQARGGVRKKEGDSDLRIRNMLNMCKVNTQGGRLLTTALVPAAAGDKENGHCYRVTRIKITSGSARSSVGTGSFQSGAFSNQLKKRERNHRTALPLTYGI